MLQHSVLLYVYFIFSFSLHLCTLVLDSLLLVDDTKLIVTTPPPHYLAWLQDWNTHMEGVSTSVLVPATARLIRHPWLYLSRHKPSNHIHLNPWLLISLQALPLAFVLVTTILEDY